MKKLILYCLVSLISIQARSLNITIIESQTGNPGHVMDTVWNNVALAMGHNSIILPQSTLDTNLFFAGTDILVVSSGVNNIPANRINIIQQFLQQGGDVYLQSEYLASFATNQAFEDLVNNLGGGFSWTTPFNGDLIPMNVVGSLATTPNAVSPLSYFWYGVAGSGCSNIEPFLEYQGSYFGFIFCSGTAGIGKMITTCDQDWIRTAAPNDMALITNILSLLADTAYQCNATSYPFLNLGNDTTICTGDSLFLNAGSGFNSYVWQNGSNDSTLLVNVSGTYYVTVTTPCNTYTDSIVVSNVSCGGIPVVSFISSDTTFCDKKCIDFTDLSTNNPTSWFWLFPGADTVSSTQQNPVNICYNAYGNFDVTLIACNGQGCDTLFIPSFIIEYQIPPPPVISQSNDTLYATPGYTYAWYDAGNPGIVISSASFFTTSNGGSYFVIITDSNGCQNSSPVFAATGNHEITGIDEDFFLVQNPVKDILQVSLNIQRPENRKIQLTLFSVLGEVLVKRNLNRQEFIMDISGISNGIYILQLNISDRILSRKIVISR